MTDAELSKLAEDFHRGMVFTDRNVKEADLLGIVFMPLVMMSKEQLAEMVDVGLIYEYMDKAGPRSINGLPTFMSFRSLTNQDAAIFIEKVEKIRAAVKAALQEAP